MPLEMQMKGLEMVKNRESMAKGAKELVSYSPVGYPGAICIWETDEFEKLVPLLNALSGVGVDTQIIPVQEEEAAMKKWEEALREGMKKR